MKERGDMNGGLVPYESKVSRLLEIITPTPEAQAQNLKNETIEMLLSLAQTGISSGEFFDECADVVIGIMGIFEQEGVSLEEHIDKKIDVAERKYALVPVYKRNGDSHNLAIARAKDVYEQTQRSIHDEELLVMREKTIFPK